MKKVLPLLFFVYGGMVGCATTKPVVEEKLPQPEVQFCAIMAVQVMVLHPVQSLIKQEPACRCILSFSNNDFVQINTVPLELCGFKAMPKKGGGKNGTLVEGQ
jgi:hypothetical protein